MIPLKTRYKGNHWNPYRKYENVFLKNKSSFLFEYNFFVYKYF